MVLGMGGDKPGEFNIAGEIKKMIIGIIFIVAIPGILFMSTDIDILQGCVTVAGDIPDDRLERINAGRDASDQLAAGDCYDFIGDSALAGNLEAQEAIRLGQDAIIWAVRGIMLAIAVAIFAGPGYKIIKH